MHRLLSRVDAGSLGATVAPFCKGAGTSSEGRQVHSAPLCFVNDPIHECYPTRHRIQ
jgi:hypothetical protein